jgi:hypothetical protein
MKYYNAKGENDRPHGMAFYGANGALFADRIGFEIYPDNDHIARRHENEAEPTPLHARNFIESVRSRKKPIADVEVGHRATLIGHLGNIAYRTGLKLDWDGEREEITNSAEANRMLTRIPRKPWDLI